MTQQKIILLSTNLEILKLLRSQFQDFCIYYASDLEILPKVAEKFSVKEILAEECFREKIQNFIFETKLPFSVKYFHNISGVCKICHEYPVSVPYDRHEIMAARAKSKSFFNLLGKSPEMQELRSKILRVAATESPVLILGENGTGKNLVARAIHELSYRENKPLCEVHLMDVSETLVEAALFGNTAASFTGAEERDGYLKSADGGTVFFDEIGDVSLNVQRKMLQFLSESKYRKIGSDEISSVDVRWLFATNADLKKKIAEKSFREDFFYRIAKVVIQVPPLRSRKQDIPLIAERFLTKFNKKLSGDAEELLTVYSWPGNIRQLENVLENAAAFCQSETITPEYLEFW